MSDITITLPDGSTRSYHPGVTGADIAADLPKSLAKKAVACKVDGEVRDLSRGIDTDARFELVLRDSPDGLEVIRHSTAHLMAQAVQDVFPGTQVTIGPVIDNGFYYDFSYERPFTVDDLEKIEHRMREIVAKDLAVYREVVPREEAVERFDKLGEEYKVEIINDLPADEEISIYGQGDWYDLCRGPHVPSTKHLSSFKLTSVAGAYWRGDEHNPMLTRIYGTAWDSDKALKKYLHFLEEAKKRDHRVLGKELDLFSFSNDVGAGFVLWHPRGATLRTLLEDFSRREHARRGYQLVYGPAVMNKNIWVTSGHYEHFKENMYFTEVEGAEYGIKPMNCPAHMLIYKSHVRSYRELPVRLFELGNVHRHELSGTLHGLLRVRAFTQDDAHILCMPDQLVDEITGVLDFVEDVIVKMFGFDIRPALSTRPEGSIGTDEMWDHATGALKDALERKGWEYAINEGDGAFYGPKIDIELVDALDRAWQCGTIQSDFALPERFDLSYIGADNARRRPVMVHRVIFGSLERFLGILLEHFAGAFPVWLAPVQAAVLPVTEAEQSYAEAVRAELAAAGVRTEMDARNETLKFRIRHAQTQKIPYMVVVGPREAASETVAARQRDGTQLDPMTPAACARRILTDHPAGWPAPLT